MGLPIHSDGNVASPSSAEDLREFLAHLAEIDRDGNKRISANELVTHILAEAQKNNPDGINQLAQIREDIAAIRTYPQLQQRWQQRDPSVTAQMIGAATDKDSIARERLGELLGYEPQFIATVLRENVSDLAALKLQQKDEADAAREAAREAAADARERAQTQREIEAALPAGRARDSVKGVTADGPKTDDEAMAEAIKQIPGGLPPELAALLPGADTAVSATRVDPQIMALRQQLSAYKPENVEMPNLGTLDKALSNLTQQTSKDNGQTVP